MDHKWNELETNRLIELYPNNRNEDIATKLSKTKSSVINKAHKLKLKKNISFKSEMVVKRNKSIGRDLTDEFLKDIAFKYKTRSDFQKNDPSAYSSSRKKGILDQICSHMTIMNFSIPQLILKDIMDSLLKENSLYNDRKTIRPYEIDIYYPNLKLAIEYNGKGWHKNSKTDEIKLKLFKKNDIKIIYINENNRRYEEDIKKQLIENLGIINSCINKQITELDINFCVIGNIYLKLYNKEDLINVAKKYDTFKEFVKLEKSVYSKLGKMKLLDEATSHMKDKRRFHSINSIKQIVKKYEFLKDLIEKDKGVYLHIKRNKLEYLIDHLKSKYKNK